VRLRLGGRGEVVAASTPHAAVDASALLHAACQGDAAAAAAIRAGLTAETITQLAAVLDVVPDGDQRELAARVVEQARARTGDATQLARLVEVLVGTGGHSSALVAEVLDVDEGVVTSAQCVAVAAAGGLLVSLPCRGWSLLVRRPGTTEAEQRAGEAHLRVCRPCRDALTALAPAHAVTPAAVVVPAQRSPRPRARR
jgi:hypothetical protein